MPVDDYREFTIQLTTGNGPVGEVKAQITNFQAPSAVQKGADAVVTITVKNVGDEAGVVYCELKEKITGIVVGNRATKTLGVNESETWEWTLTTPTGKDSWGLRAEAGH